MKYQLVISRSPALIPPHGIRNRLLVTKLGNDCIILRNKQFIKKNLRGIEQDNKIKNLCKILTYSYLHRTVVIINKKEFSKIRYKENIEKPVH